MTEKFSFSTPERPENEIAQWLAEKLKHYEKIFNFSHEDLRDKRILEIGAFDRSLAAAFISAGISTDIDSLEPALAAESKEGYASKDMLMAFMDQLPEGIRNEIEKHTIISEAEAIPVADGIYDLVIGKSVPHSSREQLSKRISELLRVGKEVRLYPITSENRSDYESVMQTIKPAPAVVEYKTTKEGDVQTEDGVAHIKEDVLILKK